MNEDKICKLYNQGLSMRCIAIKFNTNHKRISKILNNKNIKTRPPKNLRGKKKFNCNKERTYNNMATHIRFDIAFNWFMQFNDIDKVKCLNEVITNRGDRFNVNANWYKEYILKFYYDKQFNNIYSKWVKNGRSDKYLKPTIDHIHSKSKGGKNNLNNLQFLTWFENRAKCDMNQEEWDNLKNNITNYLT